MLVSQEKCLFCNCTSDFTVEDGVVLLRDAQCVNCGASLRNNDIFQSILAYFPNEVLTDKVILNASFYGAIHNKLSSFDWAKGKGHYYYSEFFDDVENGLHNSNGVLCVDLLNIPFDDNTFDLVITEDVLEHIPEAHKALGEIARVLKPGGIHVFTVPINEGIDSRIRTRNNAPVYHLDSTREEGAFVFYEYGKDICSFTETPQTITKMRRCHIFYKPTETTDLNRDYDEYLRLRMDPLKYYKYNSIVCEQVKTRKKSNRFSGFLNRFRSISNKTIYDVNDKSKTLTER